MSLVPVKSCMNGLCGTTTTAQWKRGWPMKVGGVATLCYTCGTEYDHVRYCERFHLNESGWRECKYCEKPVHCGCIVARNLHECLDSGGISCINCIRTHPLKQLINDIPNSTSRFPGTWLPSIFANRTSNITPLIKGLDKHQFTSSNPPKDFITRCTSGNDNVPTFKSPLPLSLTAEPNHNNQIFGSNLLHEQRSQQSLGFSALPTSNVVTEEKTPSFETEPRSRQTVINQLKIKSKSHRGSISVLDNRVGRPPGEGRARAQLLPRYQPKMTDQELSKIHGDVSSNCTLTPLFEKILSASDAGRIGRLVLPKACAETFFPPINQSEGVLLKIQDIKGKEWICQFRFWPNNNSRMYVLEGITLCIQDMQLQAGDTVIFSRLDPGDKLVIGCRKAAVSADASALSNPVNGDNGNLPTIVENEGPSNWDSVVSSEKKRTRNIGSKSKRLHMNSEDALELKLTWEDAQEYLRPPVSKPTVVIIENCELEEYDEPPVFGKKTIFTTNEAQLQEQWVQCDSCSKWRKIPSDVIVSSKWTCSDNISDPDRCLCAFPEEKDVKRVYKVMKSSKEYKKQKVTKDSETKQEGPTGLDTLATMAVLGENGAERNEPTTKHPRHRPGCSCIVCIQPPSGKGKHKPSCICNVCATVKRRFKTMMMRKKKRLADQGRQTNQNTQVPVVNQPETGPGPVLGPGLDLNCNPAEEQQMMLPEAVTASSIAPEWRNVLA
ncbi:B3 domain-containing transcription repressor VAL1-like [Bidens hawaiensis]|uniref:B3 domain-containing transcription repressor VAL1-like n=1 Tax=Bidens hawaiensis TaxID=980011 RepID=UPI0040497469